MLSALRARGLLWPAVMTLIGVAFLVALGNWQMRRLAWKEGLIAAIAERAHAAPIPLADAEQPRRRRRVPARQGAGKLLNDRELDFYAFDEQAAPAGTSSRRCSSPTAASCSSIAASCRRAEGSRQAARRAGPPARSRSSGSRASRRRPAPSRPRTTPARTSGTGAIFQPWPRPLCAGDKARVAPFVLDAELEPRPPAAGPRAA